MTEKEFFQQVWRPYDTVTIVGGITGRVNNVCFPTRSVRISMPQGDNEWFRCEMIERHVCATGESTDLEIIAEQHRKLEAYKREMEALKERARQAEKKLSHNYAGDLLRNVNVILNVITERKKRIEKIEDAMQKVLQTIENINSEQTNDNPT